MNLTTVKHALMLGVAAAALLSCAAALLLAPAGRVAAYDGDVDYSAPYLTVDPETGKLITVDPKAQAKARHQGSGTQPPATAAAGPADQSAGGEKSGTVAAQPAAGSRDPGAATDAAAAGLPVAVYAAGAILILLGITAAVRTSRRRHTAAPARDSPPEA